MTKYSFIFIVIFISGCSNMKNYNEHNREATQVDTNEVCTKKTRHKSFIKQCRPHVSIDNIL